MSYRRTVRALQAELGELLEEQTQTVDLASFREWDGKPVEFMREVLSFHPWTRQEEIARTLEHHPLVAVVGANSVGKDALLSHYALYWALAKGGLVLIISPTDRQNRQILFKEIRGAWHRASEGLPGRLLTHAYEPGGEEAGILAMTSTSVSRLTGHHEGRVLVILSEAQDLEPFVLEAALSNATGPEDRIVQSGNPLHPTGAFHDAAKGDTWATVTIRAADHPNVQEGRTVIPGGPSREGIERLRGQYGEDSNIYRARVLSEFPTQDAEGLISRDWIDAAVERFETKALKPTGELRAALDVARYGADGNCLMIARGPVVVHIETWGGLSTLNTARKAGEIVRGYGFRTSGHLYGQQGTITVDAVGMTGAVEGLKEMGFNVQEFNGGTFGRGQARFLNRRAEAFFDLRDRLHPDSGNIAFPSDTTLIEELLAIRWREAAGGKVRIEEKSEIKSRLGRSPDKADALSMLFGAKRRVAKTVEFRLV